MSKTLEFACWLNCTAFGALAIKCWWAGAPVLETNSYWIMAVLFLIAATLLEILEEMK